MGTKVQYCIRTKVIAQPAIEVREGMSRCKTALKQHAHRVALVTHWRLNTDQHIAEGLAEHEQVLAVSPFLAGCWTPLRFDL